MAVVNKINLWYGVCKEIKERLLARGFSRGHADRAARPRLVERMLAAISAEWAD